MNIQYQPPQIIPCVNSSSFHSIEDNTNNTNNNNNSNFISNKTTTTSSSLQYREPLLKYDTTHHDSSFQSKSEILKNLLQSQMTNGVRKDNLVKQLEILKELKTITKERINAFSTTTAA